MLSLEDKADYVHRICSAWDFRILPDPETFDLFSTWKNLFDRFPLPLSPAYHAFRSWFHWEPVPMPKGLRGPEPYHVHLDRLEGRPEDPCVNLI